MVEENGDILGEYIYNGLGQRIIKNAGGVTTVFHYDFNGNIIAESDQSGNFTKEYLYKGKGRLAMVDVATGEIFYYLNDQLGRPQILTNASNTVVWEGIYKPFGEAEVNPNSSVVNNFRLPGQYFDSETGLHYNYHRYYDPRTGRYLRPDPIGLEGGINLFLYADGNPINSTDPWGLYRMIILGDPMPGGDPIGWRHARERHGYWSALSQKILWEYSVGKFQKNLKIFLPIPSPSFFYKCAI